MSTNTILEARERRWLHKTALAERHGGSVLSLALNVPGPDKNLPGTAVAFRVLCRALREALSDFFTCGTLLCEEAVLESADGPYALWAFEVDPEKLKRAALALEENHPLGRLADLDVYSAGGGVLSRAELGLPPRRCYLCGTEAALCRRGGKHSPEDIIAFVRSLLATAAASEAADTSGHAQVQTVTHTSLHDAANGE